jgi:hypothetical protein
MKRSRKCPRGIRKSDGRCKRKPGPKRSRKMKKFRMNISKKSKKTKKAKKDDEPSEFFAGNFFHSEFAKNQEILKHFYVLLIRELNKLNESGRYCFDLKIKNIVIEKPGSTEEDWLSNDNWVHLDGLTPAQYQNKEQIDDVIPSEFQSLFMVLLFQINKVSGSFSHLQDSPRIALLTVIQEQLFTGSSKQYIVEVFQKIYNFFIYLLIVPYELLEDKYKPTQLNYLKCISVEDKHYNFDVGVDWGFTVTLSVCKQTLTQIKSYFIPINRLTGDRLDMKEDVIKKLYKNVLDNVNLSRNSHKQSNKSSETDFIDRTVNHYIELTKKNLPEIKKNLEIL